MLRSHARIAVRLGIVSKSRLLPLARSGYPLTNCTGGFLQPFARHITVLNRGHFNVEIDPIKQRSGNALPIPLHLTGPAAALAFQIAEVTTRAGIHCRDQHEFARKSNAPGRSRNGNASILQWLTHHFQSGTMKLRQLIEKEDAVVREADLAGDRNGAPAEQPDVAHSMMR